MDEDRKHKVFEYEVQMDQRFECQGSGRGPTAAASPVCFHEDHQPERLGELFLVRFPIRIPALGLTIDVQHIEGFLRAMEILSLTFTPFILLTP
mmetsp:Transcript_32884/g.37305  ORF Transcript_32884/g.37305 Transcript_32884/m.37305 type:complete len:94 (+) Transcript_32884:169-450(+)